ncbi:MAG: putative primase/helicase [Pseudonocardiales bacterium]|nr:putative primase/helicase [Pseudonocardiales bacterium]
MSNLSDVLAAAYAWHNAGAAVLPAAVDGTKRPGLAEWKTYQTRRPDLDQITRWFGVGHPGLGLICGAASGGLEMLELEGRAVAAGMLGEVSDLVAAGGLGDIWVRVTADGYAEQTPSGGLHLLYRIADAPVPGNTKLARAASGDVLAETRGEGGWVVIAPSGGPVHETGKSWTVAFGSPATVPTITMAERDALHSVFRCLDQTPVIEPATPATPRLSVVRSDGSTSPGDDYEARTSWTDILGPHGWTLVFARGPVGYWRRPGKDRGVSATTGHAADRDRLYVFSSSTGFEQEHPYTKFGAYTLLEHAGDYPAAARALRAAGYGTPTPLAGQVQAEAIAELVPPPTAARVLASVDGTAARVLAEPAPEAARFGPTEDGMARALVAHHGHNLRYCPQRGKWLRWEGHRWAWDDAERHRELIRALARDLPDEEGWVRFKQRMMSATGVTGIERLARSDSAVTVHVAALDARPYELNTPAGIIDLRTGQLGPPDAAALHTRCTTVAPDFDRRSEVFDAFLADTFADPDMVTYVRQLLGVSVVGTVLEQVLPFAFGKGANGKSTLLEAAMHVLGFGEDGYAMAAPAEMLMMRRHSEHPAELAQLLGARLVVCSELEDSQRFAEARIKQLTGRDSINARFMRRDPFTFTPSHTLWLLGNHKPDARTGGPAFWRRIRLLPFSQVVPEGRRDPRLGEKLAQDGGAILAWLATGAGEYHTLGLKEPAIVSTATAAYERDQDTVALFVEDACHRAPGRSEVRVFRDDLRAAYEQWCRQAGEEPVDAKRLVSEMRDLDGVAEGGVKGRRYFSGVCLLLPNEDGDAGSERYR